MPGPSTPRTVLIIGASRGLGYAMAEVSTDEFIRVMVTNALSPMRVIEALQDLVPPTGVIGVMSSGQGSVANNTVGLREVYRGSKAALNTFMRSFAARHSGARLTIEESVPSLVDVLMSVQGLAGLQYLDYLGLTAPW